MVDQVYQRVAEGKRGVKTFREAQIGKIAELVRKVREMEKEVRAISIEELEEMSEEVEQVKTHALGHLYFFTLP